MRVAVIGAPSSLGLRPLRPGHVPGTWRAPEVLLERGLAEAVGAERIERMEPPAYSPERQAGSGLYNGPGLRGFSLTLADRVGESVADGYWPLVVGGDCSVLLGALAGCRRGGPVGLVHLDGHSDFRHPGNYDAVRDLGAAAGMDLALATGRGEALLTDWPGVDGPLVPDHRVIQIGEREGRDPDFAWPDVRDTAMHRIEIFDALDMGVEAVLADTLGRMDGADGPFWLHLDVDVLDQVHMPAVDSPGSPGFSPDQLVVLARGLATHGRCLGMTLTIFDPERDSSGALADDLVRMMGRILG